MTDVGRAAGDGRVSRSGGTSNELHGVAVGNVVQARSIHGGIHFHTAPRGEAAVPVPRQLPPRPAHFTNRYGELAAIGDVAGNVSAGSLLIMVICGAGGTGKTALAVQALHQAAWLFPGGQLQPRSAVLLPVGRSRQERLLPAGCARSACTRQRCPPTRRRPRHCCGR